MPQMTKSDPSKAFILLLDLSEKPHDPKEDQTSMVTDLNISNKYVPYIHIVRSTGETANQLLSIPNLQTVIVIDPSISNPKHKSLAAKLVEYVKGGGNVIFGGIQWGPNHRKNDNINKIFADIFDISWRIGRNEKPMDMQMNPAISSILTGRQFRWLNWRYNLTGNYIINVKADHQVFRLRLVDDGPSIPAEKNRCAVACQKFGKGQLSFVGFSEYEESSKLIYQAMCDVA